MTSSYPPCKSLTSDLQRWDIVFATCISLHEARLWFKLGQPCLAWLGAGLAWTEMVLKAQITELDEKRTKFSLNWSEYTAFLLKYCFWYGITFLGVTMHGIRRLISWIQDLSIVYCLSNWKVFSVLWTMHLSLHWENHLPFNLPMKDLWSKGTEF